MGADPVDLYVVTLFPAAGFEPCEPYQRSEVPSDDETVAAISFRIGATGSVRTEVLRAFDAAEMGRVLAKLG